MSAALACDVLHAWEACRAGCLLACLPWQPWACRVPSVSCATCWVLQQVSLCALRVALRPLTRSWGAPAWTSSSQTRSRSRRSRWRACCCSTRRCRCGRPARAPRSAVCRVQCLLGFLRVSPPVWLSLIGTGAAPVPGLPASELCGALGPCTTHPMLACAPRSAPRPWAFAGHAGVCRGWRA